METLFNVPDYKELIYILNSETGRYEKKPERIPFLKLPFELKVEETQEQKIKDNGATIIITGRIKDKKRLFFTGLIPADFENWYFGNDYCFRNGQKKNSLVIFNFSNDNSKLIVYYFNFFYKDNRKEREDYVNLFIDRIIRKQGTDAPCNLFNYTIGN